MTWTAESSLVNTSAIPSVGTVGYIIPGTIEYSSGNWSAEAAL